MNIYNINSVVETITLVFIAIDPQSVTDRTSHRYIYLYQSHIIGFALNEDHWVVKHQTLSLPCCATALVVGSLIIEEYSLFTARKCGIMSRVIKRQMRRAINLSV